ncbi:unnamed protein product, partial [Durusdinium trenchii]
MPRVQFKAISPSMSSEDVALMLGEPREWSLMGQESSDRVMHRLHEDENNPPDEFYVSRGGSAAKAAGRLLCTPVNVETVSFELVAATQGKIRVTLKMESG